MTNKRKPRMITKTVKISKMMIDEIDKIKRDKSFTSFVRAALLDKIYQKNNREMLSITAMNSIQDSLDRIEDSIFEMNKQLDMHRRWMFHRDISFNLQHPKLPKEVRRDLIHSAKERSKENLRFFLNLYGYDLEILKDIYSPQKDLAE